MVVPVAEPDVTVPVVNIEESYGAWSSVLLDLVEHVDSEYFFLHVAVYQPKV